MKTPSETEIEANLIIQLKALGYGYVQINNANDLRINLRKQLNQLNAIELEDTPLSDGEFKTILTHLGKGIKVFGKAERLRERMPLKRENARVIHIKFLNINQWCKNYFQVTNQVRQTGTRTNRYDVTLLINGLPLVQIELKKMGIELKEAFKQINRYRRDSFAGDDSLFQYVQLFIISNFVNTKYYANNDGRLNFKDSSFWSDKENNIASNLEKFTHEFLQPCHISKMICRYIVLTTKEELMVLRPYQYHAVEAIIDKVESNPNEGGYVWHTTGSGKTLTSFKAAQILRDMDKIEKVVFVVDRRDLDHQTMKEFNKFEAGSVDGTANTNKLVKQFFDVNTRMIVTTIQKLNNAIYRENYLVKMQPLHDKRIVFIFDECHRSQFGETHQRIKKFFTNGQMIGFTGTPIFTDNPILVKGDNLQLIKQTTEGLFGKALHKYIITNAIKDKNVLPFAMECRNVSEDVADDNSRRLEKIVDYIIEDYPKKTKDKTFNAMFCVSSIDILTKYYDIFKTKEHDLKIATIFSASANEEENDSDVIDDTPQAIPPNSKEKLSSYMQDYNKLFASNFDARDSKSFYAYYNNVAKRMKNKEIDLLLVVNMFLTGFDSAILNTLYVDKNLKYQGLLQAFSRTNRTYDERKSHGNIFCFRDLKQATDDAITVFANEDAIGDVLMEDYRHYVAEYNQAYDALKTLVPNIEDVDRLIKENDEVEFVKAFRELMRFHNILSGFADFETQHLRGDITEYDSYRTKYYDIHDKAKKEADNESELAQLDFELELLNRAEIDVDYIVGLVADINRDDTKIAQQKQKILNEMNSNHKLRKKQGLMDKFIDEYLTKNNTNQYAKDAFEVFLTREKTQELTNLCQQEKLDEDRVRKLIADYQYYREIPLDKDIAETFTEELKFLERRQKIKDTWQQIDSFIEKFEPIE
ncbi:MAG: type I restriction endonuclease subunit R [Alphaproteobacteria bacterium]|nr:type I restriction endonuclease subunit R [Alphaproteobacteria bacterium]